jgi:hypothetical protein
MHYIKLEVYIYFHSVAIVHFIYLCALKIYIAPSKALVQEKLRDWNEKFGSWGINCLELTSDNELYNMRNIEEADIIVTTPEVSVHIYFAWIYHCNAN